jgi:CrcB protein
MMAVLIVFLGAGFGGALRHGVNVGAARLLGPAFPWGTLTVNVFGSLAMGLIVGWFAWRTGVSQHWRLFLTTGILGGFTTFSTFSLDSVVLYERGEGGTALLYMAASLLLSVGALLAGLQLVRMVSTGN